MTLVMDEYHENLNALRNDSEGIFQEEREIKCPFYLGHDNWRIYCDGEREENAEITPEEGTTEEYTADFCSCRWQECEYAKWLLNRIEARKKAGSGKYYRTRQKRLSTVKCPCYCERDRDTIYCLQNAPGHFAGSVIFHKKIERQKYMLQNCCGFYKDCDLYLSMMKWQKRERE